MTSPTLTVSGSVGTTTMTSPGSMSGVMLPLRTIMIMAPCQMKRRTAARIASPIATAIFPRIWPTRIIPPG